MIDARIITAQSGSVVLNSFLGDCHESLLVDAESELFAHSRFGRVYYSHLSYLASLAHLYAFVHVQVPGGAQGWD